MEFVERDPLPYRIDPGLGSLTPANQLAVTVGGPVSVSPVLDS